MKSLSKNALFNVLYKGFNLLFPLITSIYVARVLLPSGVGKVSAAQNLVQYFVIFASLGLPTYGVKKIAEASSSANKRSKTFCELFLINAITSLLCSVLYIAFVLNRYGDSDKLPLALVVGIKLYFNVINIDWFYQGMEEYGYIMQRSLIIKIASLVAVFVFVRNEADYLIYAAISTLSLVANYCFNVVNLKRYLTKFKEKLVLSSHLKPILYLLAASIAIEVYTLADVSMLDVLKGETVVGYYTTSTRIVSIVRTLVTAVCAVYLPRMSNLYSNGKQEEFIVLAKKGLSIIVSIAVPIAVGIGFTANESVLLLFGDAYQPSAVTMMILSASILTVALSNFTGYQILITIGKERIVLISTIIGAIINIVLNAILISPLNHNGAAIASVFTEGTIAVFQYYMVKREIDIGLDKRTISSTLIPATIMGMAVFCIHQFVQSLVIKIILEVCVGAAVYLFVSYKMKNAFVTMITGKIENKILRNRGVI